MATLWTGFSEEEQNKIKAELNRTPGNRRAETEQKTLNSLAVVESKSKHPKQPEYNHTSQMLQPNQEIPINSLFTSSLIKDKPNEPLTHVKLKIVEDSTSFEIMETVPATTNSNIYSCKEENKKNEDTKSTCVIGTQPPETSPNLILKSDIMDIDKKEPMNLEEFEKKRKAIEEENKLRKQMLAKALAMRKMKTQAEAHKLQQIQEELTKLDISLSNDVSILRNHIELASTDLAEAERRYSKAEREFIEAKKLLFTKRERKDLLTEHLYAIIEQNEMRKAHRLNDLMLQLSEEEPIIEITLNQVAEAEPVNKTSDNTVEV